MPLQLEYTDTYGGEANYSWVRRAWMPYIESRRVIVRNAKAWAGLTGIRCQVEEYGGDLAIRPRGMCTVLFVSYCEKGEEQGNPL